MAMIEKHYGKYIKGEIEEQFERLLGATTETRDKQALAKAGEVVEKTREEGWWAHLDSNHPERKKGHGSN